MLYYSDGGPGPAMHLLRIHAEPGCDRATWVNAKAEQWGVNTGKWFDFPEAQPDISFLGEYFLIDESEVPETQEVMRRWAAQFQ